MNAWNATILTLFPEMFPGLLGMSIPGRALDAGLWDLDLIDIRSFAFDKHRNVDAPPFGGGPGMVMRADVIDAAISSVENKSNPLVYLSPRGEKMNHKIASELATGDGITILCGRYEGIDQRVIDHHNMREISLGDFVLSGGEPAAMAIIDSIVRLLPDALGASDSLDEESFKSGLLEYPHYTRPADWNGNLVPEILLSGHHKKINAWRLAEAEKVTKKRRPDLWQSYLACNIDRSREGIKS